MADISARFAQLAQSHGNPYAAARALRFPVQTFIRIVAGMPFREGTRALAEQRLAELDAQRTAAAPPMLAISSLLPAGDLRP